MRRCTTHCVVCEESGRDTGHFASVEAFDAHRRGGACLKAPVGKKFTQVDGVCPLTRGVDSMPVRIWTALKAHKGGVEQL